MWVNGQPLACKASPRRFDSGRRLPKLIPLWTVHITGMATFTFGITVDDYDRTSCPESPWTANFHYTDADGEIVQSFEAGTGRTQLEAVVDLLTNTSNSPFGQTV